MNGSLRASKVTSMAVQPGREGALYESSRGMTARTLASARRRRRSPAPTIWVSQGRTPLAPFYQKAPIRPHRILAQTVLPRHIHHLAHSARIGTQDRPPAHFHLPFMRANGTQPQVSNLKSRVAERDRFSSITHARRGRARNQITTLTNPCEPYRKSS